MDKINFLDTSEIFISVPTWENGQWTKTDFRNREEFKLFVESTFKEPGKYGFDETILLFNEQARNFDSRNADGNGWFCRAREGTKDFRAYWDDQKDKCRNGTIFKANGKIWYLPRAYYMWINFLPINDKLKKKFAFPQIWDTQLHLALYECLAELSFLHCSILKKRQIASSYYHCAVIINLLWFEESPIIKMGASNKDYVNMKGSWKFLDEYRSFLNDKTAWYRPMNPSGEGLWQQKIEETTPDGRTSSKGLKGVVQTVTFEQKPENGVGGAMRFFFYEEGGVAPTANLTYQYILPGMQMGDITTGLFVIAGAVGELDKCEPLKQFIYKPDSYQMYAVTSTLLNDKGTTCRTGLFIPEQWSMPPYIDEWGNSLVEEALASLAASFAILKRELPPRDYQLKISQRPRTIEEAFASREESLFPLHLVNAQKRRIEDKQYSQEFLDIRRTLEGKVEVVTSNKIPIDEFPVPKNLVDKTGIFVVWERPDEGAEWGTYYASVDPVSEGKTTTSDSLCSIYIYKNPVQVTRIKHGEAENFLEGDKIVAAWCGRFDDLNKTHERLELIIEWYNAWTIVENNISLFIRHMIERKKQKYLVPKDQITFLKDLGANKNVYQDYGWKNVGTLFKDDMLNYLLAFLQEEIDTETKDNGDIVKRVYGIERIPDIMAMKEMAEYVHGLNVDRLITLAALISFAKVQQANRGYKKRIEYVDKKDLEKSKDLYKLTVSPFKNRHNNPGLGINRSPFKNIR